MNKKFLICLLLICIIALSSVPVYATAGSYIVQVDGLRVRSEPSLSGTVLGYLYKGDCIECCESSTELADGYEWRYVVTSDVGSGWVADKYLKETN